MRSAWIAVVALVVLAVVWYRIETVRSTGEESVADEEPASPAPISHPVSKEGAVDACLERVRASIASFPDAKLPEREAVTAKEVGGGRYSVSGVADARSEDGARMAVNFSCTMAVTESGNWIAENATLRER